LTKTRKGEGIFTFAFPLRSKQEPFDMVKSPPVQPKLIVHGGAWNIPEEYVAAHLAGVRSAVEQVFPKLQQGMPALDAVEAAVNILEEDPTFDAGRGAFLNEAGEIELDAMIMDGSTLGFGAVAALQNILHPVSVARQVMARTEHCMLVGKGAQLFARQAGFEVLDPEALLTERELVFFKKIKNDPRFRTHHPFQTADGSAAMDTVGAVAMDVRGNLAAATSTGGTARKLAGRVGDSPIVGAGAYADNEAGGVSATGWGESIMKVLLSKTVCDLFLQIEPMQAVQAGIAILAKKAGGLGGVIGIDGRGRYAFAHNTPKMAFAYPDEQGGVVAKITASPA
jgi:beta-aspartyl-peptidase (threonine type)